MSKLFYCRIIFCQLYIQRYIKIYSLKPAQNNKIRNILKNKDWRRKNSTAFLDEAGLLYCTPLQNIELICSYSTGLHLHNPLFTAKFCSKVSDINTKLIKTQFSLQESLQRNIPDVEIHYKTLEKLLRFEQNISEYKLFSDTFVYRRFKCRNTFVQKFIYTDKIYHNPLCSNLISWRETQSGILEYY